MVPSLAVSAQMRKGILEFCVLAWVGARKSYGWEIAKSLSKHPELLTSEGTLYPLLSRLRRQGLVETSWQESASGPPRRYYSLSDPGRAALAAFAQAWGPFNHAVSSVLQEAM